jgi:hypothetical protein
MNTEVKRDVPDVLAKTVSIVFHPLFMPLYGLGIIFTAPTIMGFLPVTVKKILFLMVLINNVFIPVTLLPLFRMRNIISSYNIEDRSERSIPLFTTAIFYSITSYIVFRFQVPVFLKTYFMASAILVVVLTIINFWWKISIHAAAAGAMTATVIVLAGKMYTPLTLYLIAIIIISGLILSSRLRLNAHNPVQVWSGYLTGLTGLILFVMIL